MAKQHHTPGCSKNLGPGNSCDCNHPIQVARRNRRKQTGTFRSEQKRGHTA